jgi:succinate dehydrogenase / fumarate reductase cytochrome b subunit
MLYSDIKTLKKMQPNSQRKRPTSPHLTIYKKQISSVLSILHRMSGIGLFFFMVCFSWWFIAFVFTDFSESLLTVFDYTIVKIIFFLASVAICYHLCTGIRHLIWDLGYGFSVPVMNITGWAAVICCAILTITFWLYIV